jgi:hypothetical protein
MSSHSGKYSLSVICPLVVVIVGCALGAVHPAATARHIGWALGIVGLAVLIAEAVALVREILLDLSEFRVQYMHQIAAGIIEYTGDIEHEWKQLNR